MIAPRKGLIPYPGKHCQGGYLELGRFGITMLSRVTEESWIVVIGILPLSARDNNRRKNMGTLCRLVFSSV